MRPEDIIIKPIITEESNAEIGRASCRERV